MRRHFALPLVFALLVGLAAGLTAEAQVLRVGLAEDPDLLDPDLARTFVGRIVFENLCDKLFNVDPSLNLVPELALDYQVSPDGRTVTLPLREGVVFHDGTPFDAEAARYNLERSLNLTGSLRRSEIAQIQAVEVADDHTVVLHLSAPFAPLQAQLADRAGMMISPAAAERLGDRFATAPVCSGEFRFVERVPQQQIVLERFPEYWDAGNVHLDRLVFLPIPDPSVRLANLQSGELDLFERVAPTDLQAVRRDPNLVLSVVPSLGYQGMTLNLSNPEPLGTPLARDVRVRRALALSIDRQVINQVVFDGEYLPGDTPLPPVSAYADPERPLPGRDVEAARRLLQEAGYDQVAFELMVSNDPQAIRVGEVIQSMAAGAGFRISLRPTEFATALDLQDAGQYEAFLIGWSGRVDPDGNIHQFQTSTGGLNVTGYSDPEVDRLLNEARVASGLEPRRALYQAAMSRFIDDYHIIYLYHTQNFVAYRKGLEGFVAVPDGLLRLKGVSLAGR
ncbi:ABC transporter substrate-binding protein [Limnochorda pilosa]|uniref:ABC transporter substrate-binding protein n=1 Tax=Limnochorda pilosa TaxID=1555112 RepID=A0A0K2SGZ7_LIMPI|nr:ABC transporter substrate-binding protein [Limnochorda pilosa]